ncbi:MAG: hypothetical protein LC734_07335 [Acidobacteria bacterium]|nr:hypothetical protein [Acidobacteriota bacterium]
MASSLIQTRAALQSMIPLSAAELGVVCTLGLERRNKSEASISREAEG